MITLHRFFIDESNVENNYVEITGDDYKHLSKSLRLQSGDKIIACTGDGQDLYVVLENFFEDKVQGKIIDRKKTKTEANYNVTIAQAIPKNRNMELIIQKATEIGAKKIFALDTKRTIVKLSDKKEKKRLARWQRIAEEAAKQSQRGIIPKIDGVFTLNDLKKLKEKYDLVLVLWASENKGSLSELIKTNNVNNDNNNILVVVGPEGGFTKNEIDLLKNEVKGNTITLGPRILRTETAPIVALTILLYELGDLGG
ncbi:MAG: RsmE family RNA methyltransferase [Bacillota bacterium]